MSLEYAIVTIKNVDGFVLVLVYIVFIGDHRPPFCLLLSALRSAFPLPPPSNRNNPKRDEEFEDALRMLCAI